MKKCLIIIFIVFCIGLISADWTPQGDINLRGIYQIKNGTNITANYFCNSTNCYKIDNFLNDSDTKYDSLSNFTNDLGFYNSRHFKI